ncbi:helicase-associated domain-containing protein [Citricoccus sp. GCM10030269]|uniref:helicase-associated domain-containing protein n=1 Tax=Citricoccus sp. GCM10030269 TaxID=3273388 RepID=UPI003622ADD0
MTAATLTERFSRWTDQRLRRLFLLRPDLCHPPVPDFAALAARASTQMSVLHALDGLDRAHLDVLEALSVLSHHQRSDPGPAASIEELTAFFSAGPDLTTVVTDLADAALVLEHDDGWHLPLPVSAALGRYPLSFGRPAVALGVDHQSNYPADREGLLELVRSHLGADLDANTEQVEQVEQVLDHVASALDALQSSPVALIPEPPGRIHGLLLSTELLVPAGQDGEGRTVAEHPLEAGLAWRNGTAGRSIDTSAPTPEAGAVPAALSRNAALAAIGDLLRGADDILTALSSAGVAGSAAGAGSALRGLPTLRSGGVGVREVKRLADAVGSSPEEAAWLLELLAAAGLIFLDPDTSHWVPGTESAAWRRSERHRQWETLVLGWMRSGRAPMLGPVPGSDAAGRALAADRDRPDAPRLRTAVLDTARELEEERPGIALDRAVPDRQRWRRPRSFTRTAAFTAPLLAEAARLGLTGASALTPAGALVAADRLEEAAADVGNALPAPLTRVRLQGDLTAVAPGYLDPEVARRLATMADAEGDGTARVYRFSEASLHRALETGATAEELEEFLTAHSEDEIPQSLHYLLLDTARRHGRLTVGASGAWLRSEDTDLLDVIVADPAMAPARLERLAPTVVVAGVGQDELHRLLTAAGHRAARTTAHTTDPNAHTPDHVARRDVTDDPGADPSEAAPNPFPEPVRAVRRVPSDDELSAQVARLRSTPRPAPTGPGTEEAVTVLRHAARHRLTVDLVTVDPQGQRHSRSVVPLAVAGGRVRCLVPDREAETVVPLHRVVSAQYIHEGNLTQMRGESRG